MRNDLAPFTDPRVRQAVALTLDRPGMVKALLDGYGSSATTTRSPRGSRPTDTSVAQRTQNIAKAKQLLSAAGHPSGFSTTLNTEQYEEIPALAQVIARRPPRSASTSSSRSRRRAPTTARRRSATPTGWTRR